MTVDHLRILHTKGMDVFNFDPHNFVMDYHGIGFRECASEVARYLVGFEGLDLQDPLRLRLMSHLQCFSAQRDLALKSPHQGATTHTPWFSTLPAVPTPQYPNMHSRNSARDLSLCSSSSSSAGGSERRPSSASSTMSVDIGSSTGGSPFSRRQPPIPLSPTAVGSSASLMSGFGRSSSLIPEGPAQPSPIRPYRPWGAEVAY
ncbi:Hairy/enhancer-of-split related with YRPW motif protein, partial [Stegodyphus mimosarum]